MNIRCTQCGHIHSISDDKVANRKFYFFCQHCAHKISVSPSSQDLTVPAEAQSSPVEFTNWKDLFSSIPVFFSIRGISVALMFYLFLVLVVSVSIAATLKHPEFFLSHRQLSLFLLFFAAFFLLFSRNLMHYYVAKINFYKFSHKGSPVDYNHIHFDFTDDFITILLYSMFCCCIPLFLLFPIYFLQEWGVLAGGILFPVFIFLSLIAFILLLTGNYVTTYIASASRYPRDHFENFMIFLKQEWLFFPFFSVIILSLRLLFAKITFFVTFVASISASMVLFLLLSYTGKQSLILFVHDLVGGAPFSFSPAGTGFLLCAFFTGVLVIVVLALNELFAQNLYAHAVFIMTRSPATSFDTASMLLLFAATIIMSVSLIYILRVCGVHLPMIAGFF